MRKIIFLFAILLMSAFSMKAGGGDSRMGVTAGFLFPKTLNASIAYEHDLSYGNAIDFMGEMGNHWQEPVCCQFWKGYYWDFGFGYHHRVTRYKNSIFRIRIGGQLGAAQTHFFLGCGLGFEYDYIFANGIRFTIMQKNDFGFLHGDHFRNGIVLGFKFPL